MLRLGQAVSLNGRLYRGGGIVAAVFNSAADAPVNVPFGKKGVLKPRPGQAFPQYGVLTSSNKLMNYNADDERGGVIAVYVPAAPVTEQKAAQDKAATIAALEKAVAAGQELISKLRG